MTQFILRGAFILVGAAVAALYAVRTFVNPGDSWKIVVTVLGAIGLCGLIVAWDVLTPRKRLSALSGVFLGLIVGMLAAYALTFLVDYAAVVVSQRVDAFDAGFETLFQGIKVFIGVICVFGAISIILQTKDDFRFVLPYVEFAKQIRGTRPMVLDTSAIIDGRILDMANTGVLTGLLVAPRFVLNELQAIADSSDKLKRARGRRGLDILTKLQTNAAVDFSVEERDAEGATVDQMLVAMSQDLHARLVTTDYNLVKIAEVRGVDVINLNDVADAMRPVVLPGERLSVEIIKPGESPGQGVGYLEDGTMVVVEQGAGKKGRTVEVIVTSMLQTSAGRMIFGTLGGSGEKKSASR